MLCAYVMQCNSKSFHEFSRLVNIDASDNQLPFGKSESLASSKIHRARVDYVN